MTKQRRVVIAELSPWSALVCRAVVACNFSWSANDEWFELDWFWLDWFWFDWFWFDWFWLDWFWFDWLWFDWLWFDWVWPVDWEIGLFKLLWFLVYSCLGCRGGIENDIEICEPWRLRLSGRRVYVLKLLILRWFQANAVQPVVQIWIVCLLELSGACCSNEFHCEQGLFHLVT